VNRWQNKVVWALALSPTFVGFVYAALEMKVSIFLFILSPLCSIITDMVIAIERGRRLRQS
jgi:hypothetical protein